jgi:flagellar hook-length control protein FliK
LAKKSAQDATPTIDPNATAANSALNATAGNTPVNAADASSTAAAIADLPGNKTEKSAAASASDSTQAAPPPGDPSANQQPIAVPISAPLIPAAPTASGGGSGAGVDGGSGQDAAQITALRDATGALRGTAVSAEAATSGNAAADARAGSTKPGAKSAGAVTPTPAQAPAPGPNDPGSANGPGQPNATDGAQSGNANGLPATEAAADRARQRALSSQQGDATAAPQNDPSGGSNGNSNVDPNGDPKPDPSAATNQIEDITRQALDPTIRHIESLSAETVSGAPVHPGNVETAAAQPTPDGAVAPANLTTAAAPADAPPTTTTPVAIPITGLAVEIASRAHAGKNRFEIRLDPPELGRIDVRLDVDREGKVTSRLVVDRPETLDILRRDAPALERSLQQAGLTTADDALQFSLRDQSGGFANQNPYSNNDQPAAATRVVIPDRELPPVDAATAGYGRVVGRSTGIDIRV